MNRKRKLVTIGMATALATGFGLGTAGAATPLGPKGPNQGQVSHPTQTLLPPNLLGPSTASGSLGGNVCAYYPPNFFDNGATNQTGDSDSASTGNTFVLLGTGGTQDSSVLGGVDSGQIEQQVGMYVQPINFLPGSTVDIPNDYSYNGVLRTEANASGVPFIGGAAHAEASFKFSLVDGVNGVNSSSVLATSSQNSNPLIPNSNEVVGSGTHDVSFAITPNTSDVLYYDGIDLVLEGSTQTAALTNAAGYAIFEGDLNGEPLQAGLAAYEAWYYHLPPNDYISSCNS